MRFNFGSALLVFAALFIVGYMPLSHDLGQPSGHPFHATAQVKSTDWSVSTKSIQEARSLRGLEDSARSGNSGAAIQLGYIYLDGHGLIKKHLNKSLRWFLVAAHDNSGRAQNIVGNFYFKGLDYGVVDYLAAAEWFSLSAKNGSALGEANFRKAISILTPEQVDLVKQRVDHCVADVPRSCDFGVGPEYIYIRTRVIPTFGIIAVIFAMLGLSFLFT